MAYRGSLTRADVTLKLTQRSKIILRELKAGLEDYQTLLDAQDGETVLAWTRRLEELADTGNVTLTMTVGTPNSVISCITGAGLFANFRPGRDVQITNFSVNAGNNKTTEILAQTSDSITISSTDVTQTVDETDTNARCQENPTQTEQDETTAGINTAAAFKEFHDCGDNVAVTTADRFALLRDYNL